MGEAVSQEIVAGSVVRFRKTADDREAAMQLNRWIGAYGSGSFIVNHRVGKGISLRDLESGKILPLGGGEGLINIGFVELCQ